MKGLLTTLKDKWPEYLLEIIVLIVGIYGAFALDNWNEQRNEYQKEQELLLGLKSSLEESKTELRIMASNNEWNVRLLKGLYEDVKSKAQYHHRMDTAFGLIIRWASPFLKSTAYESVKDYGLEFISNKELKSKLVNLYELRFAQLVEDYDKSEWMLAESVTYPYFVGRIEIRGNLASPVDYDQLIEESEFRANLSTIIPLREYGVSLCKNTIAEINEALDMINVEIE